MAKGKKKLTGRQRRYLFAKGILRKRGKGKNAKVVYKKSGGKKKRKKGGSKRITAARKNYTNRQNIANAKKGDLLGSSSSLKGAKNLIKDFYMGSNKELRQSKMNKNVYEVYGKKGLMKGVRVTKSRKRFRFEMI